MSDITIPPGDVVSHDAPCRRCGYNLRGLSPTGNCPECGTAIARSMLGDMLRAASPEWLEKLALGLRLMLWGLLISILLGIAMSSSGITPTLRNGIGFLVGLIYAYGAWLFTTLDPSRARQVEGVSMRLVARVAIAIGAANGAMGVLSEGLPLPQPIRMGISVISILMALAGLVGYIARLRYIAQVAARIPSDRLERRAKFLSIAMPVSLVVFVMMAFMGAMFAMVGGPRVATLIFVFVVLLIPLLVLFVMEIVLLVQMKTAIQAQAVSARELWSAGPP